MTGVEHYKEAERELARADIAEDDDMMNLHYAAAQVHATLAMAAATARPAIQSYYGDDSDFDREWAGVA